MAIIKPNNNTISAITALPTGLCCKVLQVVQDTKLDVFTTSSSSLTDITGLAVTITPTSSSSKIMIQASVTVSGGSADRNYLLAVTRDDTEIYKADQVGSRQRAGGGIHYMHGATQTQGTYSTNIMYLDSPSSTSAITYKIKAQVNSGSTMVINRTGDTTDNDNRATFPSSITVMEIAS